jgi:hypothetical protein
MKLFTLVSKYMVTFFAKNSQPFFPLRAKSFKYYVSPFLGPNYCKVSFIQGNNIGGDTSFIILIIHGYILQICHFCIEKC